MIEHLQSKMDNTQRRKKFSELSKRQQYRLLTAGPNQNNLNSLPRNPSEESVNIINDNYVVDNYVVDNNLETTDTEEQRMVLDLESESVRYDRPMSYPENANKNVDQFNCNNDFSKIYRPSDRPVLETPLEYCNFVTESLKMWVSQNPSVPKTAVNKLLAILNEGLTIPKTLEGLLNFGELQSDSPTSKYSITDIDGDELVEFSWIKHFKSYLKLNLNEYQQIKQIDIHVNIDGIPIFNCGRYTAYPILVSTRQFPSKIFVSSIYFQNKNSISRGMPSNEHLLDKFIEDIKVLLNEPFIVNNEVIPVRLEAVICDAVARSGIKEVVGHSGYNACDRCKIHGEYHSNRVCYTKTNCKKRSNESFRSRKHKNHHKSLEKSPFEKLNICMISNFPLDYMHNCLLGVTKRLISRLVNSGKNNKKVHFSIHQKSCINELLRKSLPFLPEEFNRRLGSIDSFSSWKASEFRTFLLYVGIYVLSFKKVVDTQFYHNFLLFSISLRMMLTDGSYSNIGIIRNMLNEFIDGVKSLYGTSFMSYNVHVLTHLPDDYVKFGNLNRVSCFKYESFLGKQIKGCVKSGFKPVQQIAKHINTLNHKTSICTSLSPSTRNISITNTCSSNTQGVCFKKLVSESGLTFRCNSYKLKDSCIKLADGRIGFITEIHKYDESVEVCVHFFSVVTDFFSSPCQSSSVGIYKVKNLSDHEWINYSSIKSKCFVCPHKDYHIVMEMLNM